MQPPNPSGLGGFLWAVIFAASESNHEFLIRHKKDFTKIRSSEHVFARCGATGSAGFDFPATLPAGTRMTRVR
jgi:hypothetical protein